MPALVIYDPASLSAGGEIGPPPLNQFAYRLLAEGDSWFTIGTLNPAKNSNLLFELRFKKDVCAVNCAYPGDTLGHIVNMAKGRDFVNLLRGNTKRSWDGILLSAGGNDLIAAVGARGNGLAKDKRLLLSSDEWGPASDGVARYLSAEGWETFSGYFRANLKAIVEIRDDAKSDSRRAPIFMHGYAAPTPRPAGAGLGAGPWLLPALQAYGIPKNDYQALARALIDRLAALIASCAADTATYPELHFFDSTKVAIDEAALDSTGESGDWVNEIHLTWRGYDKIAEPWAAQIETVLP